MKYYFYILLAALLCLTSLAKNSQTKNVNSPKFTEKNVRCGAGPNYPAIATFNGTRIINGTDAVENSWPSMIAIIRNGRFVCGGTLLDEYHILTAAHCVENILPQNTSALLILLGMHFIRPLANPQVKRNVSRVTIHSRYDTNTLQNDIAILKMTWPVTFNASISPICLLESEYSNKKFMNVKATAVGWGRVKEDPNTSASVLQQVVLETTSDFTCMTAFLSTSIYTNKIFCALYPRKGICNGDSGGPLFYQEAQGSPWIQIGLTSFILRDVPCGSPNNPSVFTRVSSYLNWINMQINRKRRRPV